MLFRRKKPLDGKRKELPEGLWEKCGNCGEIIYRAQLEKNLWVCPRCNFHWRIGAREYVKILLDDGFEEEIAPDLESLDPLNFPEYREKIKQSSKRTGLKDAALAGVGNLKGRRVVLFLTDFHFMGGSMGSVVGEKFVRSVKRAIELKVPFIALTASGGGARMHEGVISLMQMAKTTVSVLELEEAGIPYINILTDPTMGGVMASFASLGDILIAEPNALLGFAGPRVIRDTIKEELPKGFQRSEFLLEHGLIDRIVPRKELKNTVSKVLDILWFRDGKG
jgi:acetyl-CoA carboxylase carboxyl transferase subunit beta